MKAPANRPGLTLLETMVAMIILGLVVVSGLELLAGTRRLSAEADTWGRAVTYAEEALDRTAATRPLQAGTVVDSLAGELRREVRIRPTGEADLYRVDVIVTWPGGGRFELSRLAAP